MVLAGCYQSDGELLKRGLYDVLAEPRRAPLIPGFHEVQQAALDCEAFGASIGGGGPSVFGWFASRAAAERGVAAMQRAFTQASLQSDAFVGPVAGPRQRSFHECRKHARFATRSALRGDREGPGARWRSVYALADRPANGALGHVTE